MKAKSNAKPQRRTPGLSIRASLEPRLDPAGNPASDIFRAVKENQEESLQNNQNADGSVQNRNLESAKNETVQASLDSTDKFKSKNDQSYSNSQNYDLSKSVGGSAEQVEAEIVPGNALVSFGNGQMRVVSLQPPKSRKIEKKPRKMLKVVTQARESEKIPTLFERTKAEEIYDLLFQLTLGADEPCESVRVRRSDLMANTNIKTRLTLDLNLKRLEDNGLIKIESRPGEQEGNIYTVFPLPQSSS